MYLLLMGWGIGVLTQRESYHRWLALYSALMLIGYIAVLFRRFRSYCVTYR